MFPTKTLLAIDGSEDSDRAAKVAAALCSAAGSELHVAYVEPLILSGLAEREIFAANTQEEARETFGGFARKRLAELLAGVREIVGEVSGSHPRIGVPEKEIVILAEELGADLVVLGSRGRGPLRRALLGSVSTSVVRHAHCPVLVVKGKDREEDGGGAPTRILLATDGSKEARAAGTVAGEISVATGAEIHLLVVTETAPPNPYTPYPGPEAWQVGEDVLEEHEKRARDLLRREADRAKAQGAKVAGTHLRAGMPAKEIVGAAEDLGADLVVLGSRGLGAIRRSLLGSVSDVVVGHAHCPVLVFRPGAGAEDPRPVTAGDRARAPLG